METNQVLINKFLLLLEADQPTPQERYKQLRFKLVRFFAWRRCEDPEILADETVSRIIRNIVKGEEIRSETPYSYVYAVAMNVFREYLRGKKREGSPASDLADPSPVAVEITEDCRKECLEKLSVNKRKLIYRYYSDTESRENLACALGITVNALRLQIHRIKNELKACYEDCRKK